MHNKKSLRGHVLAHPSNNNFFCCNYFMLECFSHAATSDSLKFPKNIDLNFSSYICVWPSLGSAHCWKSQKVIMRSQIRCNDRIIYNLSLSYMIITTYMKTVRRRNAHWTVIILRIRHANRLPLNQQIIYLSSPSLRSLHVDPRQLLFFN